MTERQKIHNKQSLIADKDDTTERQPRSNTLSLRADNDYD